VRTALLETANLLRTSAANRRLAWPAEIRLGLNAMGDDGREMDTTQYSVCSVCPIHWTDARLQTSSHENEPRNGTNIEIQARISKAGSTQMFIGV